MTKVITAETVMKKVDNMAYLSTDGPRAALRKMEKAGDFHDFSSGKRARWSVSFLRGPAARPPTGGEKTLHAIIDANINKVAPDAPANSLFSLLGDS